jgi:hypothetical protein
VASAIAIAFGAALLVWAAVSVVRGRMWDTDEGANGDWVVRAATPVQFWLLIVLTAALGALSLAVGILIATAR